MLPNFRKPDSEGKSGFISSPVLPQTSPPPTRPIGSALRTSERGTPSVIGPELQITGNLVSRGEVQIDGEINGDVHGSNVVVGERATVTGGIVADEVVVRGHVMGSVRGKRVLLQSTCRVEGDVYHLTLAIEQGAYFEGKSRRTEDPTAGYGLAAQPETREHPPAPEPQAAEPATDPEPSETP
ncbi:MAG: polymer-forming cytoskeletal protein [Hyphomicrobium sp.]|jgi:cytoskeletal protein CcmA (bactofilin family)|nr:polymer-forming cytoskeletal protein [Hyphomicrobium sp.]